MKWPYLVMAAAVLAACNGETSRPLPVRSVSVTEIETTSMPRRRALTGVVGPYREEQIGFEIDGRVTTVLDRGFEVRGPAFDDNGSLVRQGDPIAAMEGSRYGTKVGALQAQVDAARRDLQAVEAQATLARQTLDRQKRILAEGAGTQQAVDNAQGAYDQAVAGLAARKAAVRAAEEQLDLAAEDLGDAVLYAPYSGRVTDVYVAEGAVVSAGTPIVTLTLMDPIQVRVEVSAEHERDIQTGNRAVVYAPDPADPNSTIPVNAIVYEKNAVADPRLRTFRIDLIARNARHHVNASDPELAGLPTVNEYLPVVREFQGEVGPLFVAADSILSENGSDYVLRLPGVSFNQHATRDATGLHMPEKIEVSLGDQYTKVVNWNFRSIADQGTLAEGDFVIRNPQPRYLEGVAVGRPQWLLRPRDLVPVAFDLSEAPSGFYVPLDAVVMLASEAHVFRIVDNVAEAVPVTVHETIGEQRRIVSDVLTDGDRLVVDAAWYLSDGQPVVVSRTLR